MSWPTTGAGSLATGYIATGTATTLRWGTDEVVKTVNGTSVASFAVVNRITQRNLVNNIKLPNGDGLTGGRVQLIDGVQWDISLRDDTQITNRPKVGTTVTIVDMGGLIDQVGEVYNATVVETAYEASVGQPGELNITVENLTLIESQTGSAQS